MKKRKSRIYAAVMAAAITMSLVTVPAQAAETPRFSDVDGHWGEEAIVRWADYGVIEGSNGQFRPDAGITRAEMAAAIARLLGLRETAPNTFLDVEAEAWYAEAILQCAAAGIIQGSNGMANPNGMLTRQEAAVMLGRALGIEPDGGSVDFTDGAQVAGWAAGYVSAMSDRGILNGVGGNLFAPLDDINRASVVTVLNNAITAYANEPGVTVEASGGIALVVAEDVTVTGTAEDVLIMAGGDVTVAADVSGSVTVSAEGVDVTVVEDASVSAVAVAESAAGASVTVAENAAVETVTVAAPESSVSVSGTVETVTVAETAGETTITANRGATITSVDNSAAGVTVSGTGTVETMTTTGNDTTVNTHDTELTVAEGVTGVTENNRDVAGGENITTSRPSSGGGSSGSSHSHSYTDGVCSCGAYDPVWAQVDSAEDWNTAMAAGTQNIIVTASFTADAQLQITRGVTVNGRNNIITAGSWEDANADSRGDASLLLVNAGANEVIIKNIALTGANTIPAPAEGDVGDDYGHGLNVYCSSNVTLNNVTLTDNDGVGLLVNSSAVTATGLHTSDNGWGGVNIDANVTDVAASLIFDVTSTFGETVPVYSDNGGVTVTAPEGYVEVSVEGKTVWLRLFDGGDGTAANPYEIATARQLGYVGNISGTETAPVYVQLSADIDLSTTNGLYGAYQLDNIVFDGNEHRIYSASAKRIYGVFAYTLGKTEIKNLTYDLSNLDSYAYSEDCVALIYSAKGGNYTNGTTDSLVLNGVTVTGSGSCTGNCGAFIANEFMPEGSTITFTGCTYDADIVGTGYNACFIGWQYPENSTIDNQQVSVGPKIAFNSCSVTGELVANQAAVFVANGSNAGVREYEFSNNTISGTVRGTQVAKYFTAVSFGAHTALETAAQNSCTTTTDRNVYVGATDNKLAISVDEDKKISITASDNTDVTSYKVEIGIYTDLYKDNKKTGTWLFFAVAEINASNVSNISICAYDFIDSGYEGLGEITQDTYGNNVATLNGTTYYVVSNYIDDAGNQGYVGTPDSLGTKAAQIIRVTAYEGETMYSSASYK